MTDFMLVNPLVKQPTGHRVLIKYRPADATHGPGGFEILAAARPDLIVLQHAPARRDYDGFPGYQIQPLARQIEAIELLSGRPVAAITINHEDLKSEQIPLVCDAIQKVVGLPTFDVLRDGANDLVQILALAATT